MLQTREKQSNQLPLTQGSEHNAKYEPSLTQYDNEHEKTWPTIRKYKEKQTTPAPAP